MLSGQLCVLFLLLAASLARPPPKHAPVNSSVPVGVSPPSVSPTTNSSGSTNGRPFGFASKVTGGGGAAPVTPKDEEDLKRLLADDVPRVIHLDKLFDFAKSGKEVSAKGCSPFPACQNGNRVQHALNYQGWCEKEAPKPIAWISVTYNDAAMSPLEVGSHKTLLGIGSSGGITGTGLIVNGKENIIIQNIIISDLNPAVVWAGDAIHLNGAKDIWIDHCTFKNIGRQMIDSSSLPSTGLTISNNHFDGLTSYSPGCHNEHYWTLYLDSPKAEATIGNNCFNHTAGRAPKVGSGSDSDVIVHYFNNLHLSGRGHSFEIVGGAKLLGEGNVFQDLQPIDPDDTQTERGGESFVPFTKVETQQCVGPLGRPCVPNLCVETNGLKFGETMGILNKFGTFQEVREVKIVPPEQMKNLPPGGCGVGSMP